ncbi:MAG: bifunctional 4-hydroxy-2-oxoglutarate aldolase/2-dehydro-3-deoxy-phosphogluconate aldolase [Acidobacteria bacterium]|nr:bifunctional 4-hydroxy-2-oxoglutarate aldolase/2-dehydro-3-deoxy-phosphogluconate aldolase [Acidobacteriota bacterium]
MDIRSLLDSAPILPLLRIERTEDAVPLAGALLDGGIVVQEVALRTAAALPAIARIANELPEVIVGAGTVRRADDVHAARDAGARFGVSPGITPAIANAAAAAGLPFLPGVATPSEIQGAVDMGFLTCKFFPAPACGGLPFLRAVHGPFPDVAFCPTGNLDRANYREYLAEPNVVSVGVSWITPAEAVAARAWGRVAELARATVEEVREVPGTVAASAVGS